MAVLGQLFLCGFELGNTSVEVREEFFEFFNDATLLRNRANSYSQGSNLREIYSRAGRTLGLAFELLYYVFCVYLVAQKFMINPLVQKSGTHYVSDKHTLFDTGWCYASFT